jgi:nucleotide-binding universal stress UspA family protein
MGKTFEKILVCLDGSIFSEGILPYAIGEALKFKSRLTLLHVLTRDIPMFALPSAEPMRFIPFDLFALEMEERRDRMRSYLEGTAAKLTSAGLEAGWVLMSGRVADVSDVITQYALSNHFDLIAMATHGYRGLKRLFLGSISDSVTRKSSLPVLVLRPGAPALDRDAFDCAPDLTFSTN